MRAQRLFSLLRPRNLLERIPRVVQESVVYIYHDVIDATGDKAVSERRTFSAVKALAELSRFIKSIHAHLMLSVYVTADHGFLYSDKRLEDPDKEALPGTDHLSSHNRYFLTREKQELKIGYSFPLSATSCFDDELHVNIGSTIVTENKGLVTNLCTAVVHSKNLFL